MEIHERVREARKELNLSQEAFGKELGISRSMVVNLEMGKLKNKDQVKRYCRTISNVFNINETWLLTGEGEMHSEMTREQAVARVVAEMQLEPDSFRAKAIMMLADLEKEEIESLESVFRKFMEEFKDE